MTKLNWTFALFVIYAFLVGITYDVSGQPIVPISKRSSSQTRMINYAWTALPMKMEPTDCPETSITNHQRRVTSQKNEGLHCKAAEI